jgi:hypothetical protein
MCEPQVQIGNSSLTPMRWYRCAFWIFATASGLLQAWQYRFFIEPDGVNYLDVASAYLRHDWPVAINSYWSPLYSWLLAVVFYLFHPSPYWESTALHALNFVIFLVALLCGEYFIQELLVHQTDDRMPSWVLWSIGYCLLLFVSLFMVPVYWDTPDLCVSAFVYLTAGLLLRIRSGRAELRTYIIFGSLLGIAYLAKTVMFLVAFAFLFAAGRRRGTAIAFVCFVAISLPWIVILSHSVKHLTYGDAGTLNYIYYVDHAGVALHPPHVLFASPEVREFVDPIRATYPPYFNGPYWSQGLRPRFRVSAQIEALRRTTKEYLHILSGQKEFIAAWIVLFLAGFRRIDLCWPVLLPVFAAIGLYAVVGHVEARLMGPFFVLFWLTLFAGLHVRAPRLLLCVTLAVAAITVFRVSKAAVLTPLHATHVQWETAEALHKMGFPPGTRVAYFGHTTVADYWARLAGFQIAADIQKEAMPEFWSAQSDVQKEIFARLSSFGIRAVLTSGVPPSSSKEWQAIPNTPYSVHLCDQLVTVSLRTPRHFDRAR